MSRSPYEPIDAGDGRRLERFGALVVDRPAPGATEPRRDPEAWASAGARFDRGAGEDGWTFELPAPDPWRLSLAGLELELRPAAAGQVGVFPEQLPVWLAIGDALRGRSATVSDAARTRASRGTVLSLFGYTGAATLTCAAAGAAVVHVDASRTAVAWARRNAERSGLAAEPIRWIADDARSFVAREVRRRRRYDGFVLDPPSYGHGPDGRAWRIDRDLEPLMEALAELRSEELAFVALTAHSPAHDPDRLARLLGTFGPGRVEGAPLELSATSGARLPLGAAATWRPA